ncbi:MAG: MBL fold metallo-hydrolase [Proteobacteria bacterium]|nr:MBL fold metallo-hydrolase [Pseudomonadota bacterium]
MRLRWIAVAALIVMAWIAAPVGAQAQTAPVKLEWFSWSIFRLTSPTGKVVLINPFVTNPDSPVKVDDFPKVDVIVVADGHGDEVGSTDEIAIKTGAKIVTSFEMYSVYFEPRKVPLSQVLRSSPGDWNKIDGITIRNVGSVHGSGTPDKLYGGAAMGFVMTFENGTTVYFGGSTALTLDMQLWGRLYKPDVAILHMSANKDPQELVEVVRLLRTDNPNLKTIIPHHHRLVVPPGGTTIADYEKAIKDSGLPVTLLNPELKKVYDLTR